MKEYSIDRVWQSAAADVQEDVIRFWLNESAMLEGAAHDRSEQLVAIARESQTRQVAGVSTGIRHFDPQLGLTCYFFRTFVGKAHRVVGLRSSNIVLCLVRESYDVLDGLYQAGVDRDITGLYFELENSKVARRKKDLVWTDLGANIVFIGMTSAGLQRRIWYFENAVMPTSL